jgi:NAD(P)-dependent dehydrogenase (short-subunit alcohol dehydrogenase family)
MSMDYQGRYVVVTGGTGALGAAVLDALLQAGAICHVPYRSEQAIERCPHRGNERVSFAAVSDLADETSVTRYYEGLNGLWASIHLAGTFAAAPIARSDKALLMTQLETNLVSAYLCSRSAAMTLRRLGSGGRIVNVAARQALEHRLGAGSVAYTIAKAGGCGADHFARCGTCEGGHSRQRRCALNHGHAEQSDRDAECGLPVLAESRGCRCHDPVSGVPGEHSHARRRGSRVR